MQKAAKDVLRFFLGTVGWPSFSLLLYFFFIFFISFYDRPSDRPSCSGHFVALLSTVVPYCVPTFLFFLLLLLLFSNVYLLIDCPLARHALLDTGLEENDTVLRASSFLSTSSSSALLGITTARRRRGGGRRNEEDMSSSSRTRP